ncbi:SH3 domain-containing protein [Streptomyces sp. NBC_00986]|uniref:SH3 domain-containing protein n=1 Tax=Streptomyces sp. NBC_00986 TaxID=2903702 RepID=UPI00386F7ED8|nr:SH3 domain-containing protein [Streptomyces sp. NBC_00986]
MSVLTRTGLAFAAVAALVVPTVTGLSAGTAMANAPCGSSAPGDHDDSSWNATGNNSRMRSGTNAASTTNCAIKSTARPGDRLDYHCYTRGNDGYTWTYLRNDTRSPDTYGWVRDDVLSDGGSFVECPEYPIPG